MGRDAQKRGPEAGSFREWLDYLLHTGLPSVGAAEHFTPSLHGVDSRPHPQGGSSELRGRGERERPLQSKLAAGNGLLESFCSPTLFKLGRPLNRGVLLSLTGRGCGIRG